MALNFNGLFLVKANSLEEYAGRVDKEWDIGRHVKSNQFLKVA